MLYFARFKVKTFCERSRNLRISFTKNENVPELVFSSGTYYAYGLNFVHIFATMGELLPHLGRQLPTKLLGYVRLVAMVLVPQHGRNRIYRLAWPIRAARYA